ncbi:MAG: PrgI family protein [Lachnospiraceae bacterium]|nr:PrgI family protein [Lachnospiraceae bacterium]
MAASYISVPRDLTKVKSKVMFNLTKRQLICFSVAALLGVPSFFLIKHIASTSTAAIGMMVIMMPFFFLAMYEKNGQHLEVLMGHLIEATFIRPKERPYKTDNHYAALERYAQANDEIINIIMYNLAMEPERNKKRKEDVNFDQFFEEKRKARIKYTR